MDPNDTNITEPLDPLASTGSHTHKKIPRRYSSAATAAAQDPVCASTDRASVLKCQHALLLTCWVCKTTKAYRETGGISQGAFGSRKANFRPLPCPSLPPRRMPTTLQEAAVPPPCSNLSKPPSPGSLLDPPTRMRWLLLLGAHLWIPSLTCLVPAMPVLPDLRADAHWLKAGLTHVKKECAHVCGWC